MRNHPEQHPNIESGLDGAALESTKSPEQELSPEKQEIVAKAKLERAKLLLGSLVEQVRSIAKSPVAKKAANALPYIGDAFLLTRAARGKEGHRELTNSERALYVLVAACSLTATTLLISGERGIGGGLKIFADALQHADALPTYFQSGARMAQDINPRLAAVLLAAANFIITKRGEISQLKEFFDSTPIALNLNETA